MKLYLAFYDFYSVIIGVFDSLEDAIEAAKKEGSDAWVEEWTLDVANESEVVWRAGDA